MLQNSSAHMFQGDYYEALSKEHLKKNDFYAAIKTLVEANRQSPDHKYRSMIAAIIKKLSIDSYDPICEEAVQVCLEDSDINHSYMFFSWDSFLRTKPAYAVFRQLSSYEEFIDRIDDVKSAIDEFFLLGLRTLRVRDYGPGGIVLLLRRYLLENYAPDCFDLLCSLSKLCFFNEHIYEETPDETRLIDDISGRLQSRNMEGDALLYNILIYSCYRPLKNLEDIKALQQLVSSKNSLVQGIFKEQVDEPLEELKIKKTIKSYGQIHNHISQKVRHQYEENPYPRWKNIGSNEYGIQGAKYILVAGCGTGYQVAKLAMAFPDSIITAIDLSSSSLSYAARRCRELGLKNIQFYQGDILDVEELDQIFDLIVCSGVLHHMEDPFKGWEKLNAVLCNNGIMEIALYSKKAREHITQIRAFIEDKGYQNDNFEDIKACRKSLMDLPQDNPMSFITKSSDFYTMSTCRDLLFHEKEHLFTLPQIGKIMNKLDLIPLRFILPDVARVQHYISLFPRDQQRRDLESLHAYEEKFPGTFSGMYQFFCKKTV